MVTVPKPDAAAPAKCEPHPNCAAITLCILLAQLVACVEPPPPRAAGGTVAQESTIQAAPVRVAQPGPPVPDEPGPIPDEAGVAVSLKALQDRARHCGWLVPCGKDVTTLGGMTSVDGYVTSPGTRDVIIYGRAEPESGVPPIRTEDLVVALRASWMKYAEREGDILRYANPGCTIDPEPAVLGRLGTALADVDPGDDASMRAAKLRWEEVCTQDQLVKVFGVPQDSHFAAVMVQADYDLKRIVDGEDKLELPAFESLSGMYMAMARAAVLRRTQGPGAMMSRFWFTPRPIAAGDADSDVAGTFDAVLSHDDDIVEIRNFGLMLRTEAEYLSSTGKIAGKGRADALAETWARTFTDQYTAIGEQRPVYRELDNLGRLWVLARDIRSSAAFESSNLSVEWLLEGYASPKSPFESTLPGRAGWTVDRLEQQLPGGVSVAHLVVPSCGGVTLDVGEKRIRRVRESGSRLPALRATILLGHRQHGREVAWSF